MKRKMKRKCNKCDGWGSWSLQSIRNKQIYRKLVRCEKCKGTGEITKEIEVLDE